MTNSPVSAAASTPESEKKAEGASAQANKPQ
jgi:hypothetical protein